MIRYTKMHRCGQSGRFGGPGRREDNSARLGELLQKVMVERISPLQARFGELADVWSDVVPQELYEHCEIVDVLSGELKVSVDSSPYMYELRLCSAELLQELQRQCPRARLKRIKFVLG